MKFKAFICAAVTSVALVAATTSAKAENVTILGGGVKGQAYQFAVGLTKILADGSDINATAQSSKGMVAQARLLERGDADFAFGIGGPIGAWSYKGIQRFEDEGPKENLRAMLSYPAGMLQWLTLADSGIATVADLKGKRISLGGASSTTQTFGRILLEAAGIGPDDYTEVTPGFSEGFGALRDGNVDAHLTVGTAPFGGVQELASVKQIRILQQDAAQLASVVESYGPGIAVVDIAADAYGDSQVNDEASNALGVFFGFSTGTHMDDEVVYGIMKELFDNIDTFHGSATAASAVNLESACNGLAFPLHDGAKKFLVEAGAPGC